MVDQDTFGVSRIRSRSRILTSVLVLRLDAEEVKMNCSTTLGTDNEINE